MCDLGLGHGLFPFRPGFATLDDVRKGMAKVFQSPIRTKVKAHKKARRNGSKTNQVLNHQGEKNDTTKHDAKPNQHADE